MMYADMIIIISRLPNNQCDALSSEAVQSQSRIEARSSAK